MKNYKMGDTVNRALPDEDIKHLLEEALEEMVSMKRDLCNLYEKALYFDDNIEVLENKSEKIIYQAQYASLLFEKLNIALNDRNVNVLPGGKK